MKPIAFPSRLTTRVGSFINPIAIWERLSRPHPSIREPERRRRVILLSSLLLVLNLGGILSLLMALWMDGPTILILNLLISGILLAFTYGLSRTRHYSAAALLALSVIWISVLYSSILFLDAEILHFLILGVLFSSLFLSPRATLLVSAGFVASILSLPHLVSGITYTSLSVPAFSVGLTGLLAIVAAAIQSLDFRHIAQQSRELSDQVVELVRGREALHRSEARLANILENAAEAIISVDKDQTIILFNNGAERIFGYQSSEVLGRPLDILLPPEFIEHHRRHVEGFSGSTMIGSSAHKRQELWGRRKDGSSFPAQIGISSHIERDEVISTAVLFDITESKKAKEALDRSELLYRKFFEDANDAIFLMNLDGVHTQVNRKAAELLGYRPEELVGMKISEVVVTTELQDASRVMQSLLAGESLPLYERIFRKKDGTEFPVEINATLLKDSDGAPLNIQSIVRDITERKQNERQIQRQIKRLSGMRSIEQAITSSLDLRVTLDVLISQVIEQLGVNAVDILLFNPVSKLFETNTRQGFHTGTLRDTQLRLGESYAGQAALEQRIIHIPNLDEMPDGSSQAGLLARNGYKSYYAVPLVAKGQVKGVLEIFNRTILAPDPEREEFLESLAAQAAIAIDNAQLFRESQRANLDLELAYDATIEGWSHALDLRDQETEGHTLRVTEMTLRLARAMNVSEAELVHMRRGALLHDIGKMGIPDSILLKPGPLDEDEWELMRKHPIYAYQMIAPIAYLRPAVDIPYCHHEKWDGTGYPRGFKGEQIPLVARIFAVVDVWDALSSDRPYRSAWPKKKVEVYIQEQAGIHFDPHVIESFMKLL